MVKIYFFIQVIKSQENDLGQIVPPPKKLEDISNNKSNHKIFSESLK